MKRLIAVMLAALLLCGITAAQAIEADGYVVTNGQINDQQQYFGTWQQSYIQILNNHSSPIHTYQNRTLEFYSNNTYLQVPCKPVLLTDITADGIPELVFMEAVPAKNGNLRGDLYIYSSNGSYAECILYVPGITRPGYDDVGLGFDIYLSSANSGTLVLEYYEFEKPWYIQLTWAYSNRYSLLNYLTVEADYSGEGDDVFYLNGAAISQAGFEADIQILRSGRTMTVSEYFAEDNSRYGLLTDWESTVTMLKGFNTPTAAPPANTQTNNGNQTNNQTNSGNQQKEVYGLTINKLATRKGPGTQYEEGGTYSVKGQYIKVLAKAWDKRNSIWWVKCEIPYHGEIRVLWTGYKRFDHSTLSLDDLPEEIW